MHGPLALACSAAHTTLPATPAARQPQDLVDRVSPASGAELVVEFGGRPISAGQLLRPGAAVAPPRIAVRGGAEGGLFTVVSSDPDPPDPAHPKFREWLVRQRAAGLGLTAADRTPGG